MNSCMKGNLGAAHETAMVRSHVARHLPAHASVAYCLSISLRLPSPGVSLLACPLVSHHCASRLTCLAPGTVASLTSRVEHWRPWLQKHIKDPSSWVLLQCIPFHLLDEEKLPTIQHFKFTISTFNCLISMSVLFSFNICNVKYWI